MHCVSKTFTLAVSAGALAASMLLVGCGGAGGPISPSSSTPSLATGATIGGFVSGGAAPVATLAGLRTLGAVSGVTVAVVGTDLSATADAAGRFQIAGVPPGDVRLRFGDTSRNDTVVLSNVSEDERIEIEVSIGNGPATIVSEVRSRGKIVLCHLTGTGQYHQIEVSVSAEPAHRAHGDGAIGDRVPADRTKIFDATCSPALPGVTIKKSTNGHDADVAPGPSIPVGSPITWTYVVSNTSDVALTNVVVADDRGVVVICGQTTIPAGQSITCSGTGIAVAGPYRNTGTVTATMTGVQVTASDPSHYVGVLEALPERKVQLCHRTGNGSFHMIEVSVSAEPAHRAHGDGMVGEPVPGRAGTVFNSSCTPIAQ
jgi:hypothetical protein